jgi:hypothetical protein
MTSSNQLETEVQAERIRQLEDQVLNAQADIQNILILIKDMQKVIVKIATNQQQLNERVSMWPYIKVSESDD